MKWLYSSEGDIFLGEDIFPDPNMSVQRTVILFNFYSPILMKFNESEIFFNKICVCISQRCISDFMFFSQNLLDEYSIFIDEEYAILRLSCP